MKGCYDCQYAIYDSSTGLYECKREDYLTEADTDDLTETGGLNCSQWKECEPDYDPDLIMVEMNNITPGQLHEIIADILGE